MEREINMKATENERKLVETLMEKYDLKKKDLFSFCICAVNFLEYWEEEGMIDVMYSCPDKYGYCDSNNTRAVAGALKEEMNKEGCDEVDQFIWYAKRVQWELKDHSEDTRDSAKDRFQDNFVKRFSNCYQRDIIIPYIIGTDIEKFDDTRWEEYDHINKLVDAKNFEFIK